MKKICNVDFDSNSDCIYMRYDKGDKELYTEVLYKDIPYKVESDEYITYSYPILKEEILRQAEKAGINKDTITFPYECIIQNLDRNALCEKLQSEDISAWTSADSNHHYVYVQYSGCISSIVTTSNDNFSSYASKDMILVHDFQYNGESAFDIINVDECFPYMTEDDKKRFESWLKANDCEDYNDADVYSCLDWMQENTEAIEKLLRDSDYCSKEQYESIVDDFLNHLKKMETKKYIKTKKYTQEDFDEFPEDLDGFKICPTGDYAEIKHFGNHCSFGKGCKFGEGCDFGDGCRFGEGCKFGEGCDFGKGCSFKQCDFGNYCGFDASCSFSSGCTFGMGCIFDVNCEFGMACRFSERCNFDNRCSFGGNSKFGERCKFGEGCSHEKLTNSRYIAVDRIGDEQNKIYFFKSDEGLFVRSSSFFGTIEDFEKYVHKEYSGAKHESHYLKAVELAKLMLAEED